MFFVQFLDGSWFTSVDGFWDDLPYKPIAKLLTYDSSQNQHIVEGYDCYLYSEEAISASLGAGFNTKRYVGGFNNKTGDGELVTIILNDLGCDTNGIFAIPSKVVERTFCNKKDLNFGNNAYKVNP